MLAISTPHDFLVGDPHVAEVVALTVVVDGFDGLAAHVFTDMAHRSLNSHFEQPSSSGSTCLIAKLSSMHTNVPS